MSTAFAIGYIGKAEACITAEQDLDGRSSPSSSASRTTNVYKSGACINGKDWSIENFIENAMTYETIVNSKMPNHRRHFIW